MANLLQVSSAFGRAMETVDRDQRRSGPSTRSLLARRAGRGRRGRRSANALACAAEGYPFPTNLDLDENVDGLTPLAQTALVQQALDEGWEPARVADALDAYAARHRTDEI